MNTSDGDLSDMDAKKSQATQLMQAALEKLPEPSERQGRSATSVQNSVISIDSFPSSKNSGVNSVFQYDLHGLAGTDTQLDDEDEGESALTAKTEGSQKENFATASEKSSKDINQDMSSTNSRPYSPHGLSIKDNMTIDGRAGRASKVSKKSQLPAVTLQPPIKTSIPRQQTPRLVTTKEKLVPLQPSHQRANRSCSPTLSEDSFARGDTQLKEEQYLVTSKKFTTPLVDLAHIDDDDDLLIGSNHRAQSIETTSFPRDEKDEPPPIVLVPSTPSQSEGSDYSKDENLWKSPQDEDNPKRSRNSSRMVLDSESGKSSQYSQGFDGREEVAEVEGLYSGARPKRSLPAHKDASRGTELATQIVTHEEPSVPETPNIIPQTNSSTYTHTGTRSLLNHMDPNKRGRYQHLLRPSPTSPESSVSRKLSGRGFSGSEKNVNCAETGPSTFSELQILSNSGVTSVQIPSRKPSPKKLASHQIPSVDTMDIVPDSEPMQEQVQSPVLENPVSRLGKADLSIRTGNVQRLSNDSEITDGSDAFTMPKKSAPGEEEEEEVGLVNEKGLRDSAGSGYDPDWAVNDDDDDDDKPLFTRLHKGKRHPVRKKHPGLTHIHTFKSKSETKAKRPLPIAEIKQSARQQRGQQGSKDSSTNVRDPCHESAVPSSVPDQDHSLVSFRKPKAAAAAQEKDTKGKGSRAVSVLRSSRSDHSTTAEVDDGRDLDMEVVIENERVIEAVVDNVSEEEGYMESEATRHSLKRKRRQLPKSQSMAQVLMTPQTRTTKRLKSAGSTISKTGATRVFALWKQNKLWYSGIVYEHLSASAYMVKFDDNHEAVVSTEHMRTNDLRVGDLVRFKGNKDIEITKVNNRSNAVAIEGEPDMLEFKDIGISTKVINSSWQDRLVDPQSVVAAVRDIDVKVKSTPSPSRSATSLHSLNTNAKGPRQSHKFLQKVGLIVSLGSNTNDRTEDGKSRSDILRAVRDSGGVIVDDLFRYLKMDILFSTHRWIIERDSVQWIGEPKELQRLFLIADNYNLKPKYLMALALGIPCLSTKWLYACLEAVSVMVFIMPTSIHAQYQSRELDWRPYLLPQGRPTILESVLPSQQVDLCWGERPEHLFDIMENPVASRLLEGQSVLCAGPDMTPKGKDVDKASFIVRIILAMGAKRVEAVRDVSHAANPLSQYNLLILREKEQYTRDCVQTHTVDWNWIKDSLIMSRRLNYPIWSVDESSQCSQTL